jgi:hypothetical protein
MFNQKADLNPKTKPFTLSQKIVPKLTSLVLMWEKRRRKKSPKSISFLLRL